MLIPAPEGLGERRPAPVRPVLANFILFVGLPGDTRLIKAATLNPRLLTIVTEAGLLLRKEAGRIKYLRSHRPCV
jgi:hypothetical protein